MMMTVGMVTATMVSALMNIMLTTIKALTDVMMRMIIAMMTG